MAVSLFSCPSFTRCAIIDGMSAQGKSFMYTSGQFPMKSFIFKSSSSLNFASLRLLNTARTSPAFAKISSKLTFNAEFTGGYFSEISFNRRYDAICSAASEAERRKVVKYESISMKYSESAPASTELTKSRMIDMRSKKFFCAENSL